MGYPSLWQYKGRYVYLRLDRYPNLLGLFYLDGIFVDQNYDIAHSYFSEAAKQELPEAWLELGAIYGKGLGVEADRALSIEFYEKAAELGDVMADFNLGVIFINADGVPRDVDRGIKHLINAAELGHEEAKLVLLKLKEEHGFNVPTYVTVQ
jgi:TPR repeat protein